MIIKNLETCRRSFVTPGEFAEYLVVSERTIYHWVSKGALKVLRVERTIRIPIEEARRFAKYSVAS